MKTLEELGVLPKEGLYSSYAKRKVLDLLQDTNPKAYRDAMFGQWTSLPEAASKPTGSELTAVQQRQLDTMRKHHNAVLATLSDATLKRVAGDMMASFERKFAEVLYSSPVVYYADPKRVPEYAPGVYTDVKLTPATPPGQCFPVEDRGDRQEPAAVVDFTSFTDPTRLHDTLLCGEFGAVAEPSFRRHRSKRPKRC